MEDTDRTVSSVVRAGIALLLLILCSAAGCASCTLVEPGHVGIRVERAGANRGVQDLPMVSGWVAFNPITTTIIEFPTTTQTTVWTASPHEGRAVDESITFSSREGVTVSADVALSYHVDAAHAGRLYTRFRTTDLSQLTHGFVRNVVRDVLNEQAARREIHDIYGAGKTQMLNDALSEVRTRMGNDGFVVDQLSFQGALRLPQNVVDAINRAMQATQDALTAQNRVAQVEAEARQRVAAAEGEANAARAHAHGDADALRIRTEADAAARVAMARAAAEANAALQASLTPAVLEYTRLSRWNGALPQVQGPGTPLVQLGSSVAR